MDIFQVGMLLWVAPGILGGVEIVQDHMASNSWDPFAKM